MHKLSTRIIAYYYLKPLIPRRLQLWIRHLRAYKKRRECALEWPILESAGHKPSNWVGWPEQKDFAFILTHDVDTARGQERCYQLMELEMTLGLRSSFNFVPECYPIDLDLLRDLVRNGFEIGVHGLKHDVKCFSSKSIFMERAFKINQYLKSWGAVGFRAPAMVCNLEWIHSLDIEYDASTFDTDPFEPQPEGVGTVFPFWVENPSNANGYVELPYTLVQDFTLFILLREKTFAIWQQKLDWIFNRRGMALINTHPDYMNFENRLCGKEEYPASYYGKFLEYVKAKYEGRYWHVLPKEIARHWRANCRYCKGVFSCSLIKRCKIV